mmetsp:Transcript_3544/g.8074  ORF Transcript_3544/g.8074 Transcript_3544/m.8074 type:complete len:246 (-) Transcript_3544:98-835(-)|eukprot:CAMPEP_0113615220 /NCGR_PEP_ID=MMETSP0017_2-20120614/7588_1 /TAXON_ID=2856 /ORGANISM="Cylindrotheca closterium" /LENGTH=245 /DNA_ID=CAMNT_0000524449 /DNA_START=201 /DNA_END=938 /DNA_ORIENTATION=+ /assembly_acc=CAM_ASM_000147
MWQSSLFLLLISSAAYAFVPQSTSPWVLQKTTQLAAKSQNNSNDLASSLLAASLAVAVAASNPLLPAQAYAPSDYASDIVQDAVTTLKQNRGNMEGTFQAYETIAEIITEGKGVGGMVNYKGVALDRGYVADEDTSVYNPGLTLLTESEKERLVEAVVGARKEGINKGKWDENIERAYAEVKGKLDPFHTYELRGFLGFAPYYGAILYLGVFAVQQFARGLFPVAYGLGVLAFFGPIIAIVAAGP